MRSLELKASRPSLPEPKLISMTIAGVRHFFKVNCVWRSMCSVSELMICRWTISYIGNNNTDISSLDPQAKRDATLVKPRPTRLQHSFLRPLRMGTHISEHARSSL